jgi:hypothetical protein
MDADAVNEAAIVASAALVLALNGYGEMAEIAALGLPVAPELRHLAREQTKHAIAKLDALAKALREETAQWESQFDSYEACARALAHMPSESATVN